MSNGVSGFEDKTTAFKIKRALSQDEIDTFLTKMRNAKDVGDYREIICKFFIRVNTQRMFHRILNIMEETKIKPLDNKAFQRWWNETAYTEHNLKIQSTRDSIVMLGSMQGGTYHKKSLSLKDGL
jgi:hypothetical protein